MSKITTIFSAEKIILQYCVLSFYINLYFPHHKLAIEIDEQGHKERDTFCEIERQKAIEKELNYEFVRINQIKKILIFLLKLAKYKVTLLNQQKN